MATGRITKRLVDALIAEAKRTGRTLITWDEDLTRFGVLATKTGSAAFVIQYRMGGRGTTSKRVTLGKYGAITPDEARKLASSKLGQVDSGRDVAQERKDARRKLAAGTFKDACTRYLDVAGKSNKSWPETRRLLEFDAVPVLGAKPIVSVTRTDVTSLLDDVAARAPSVARALFAAMRPMFRWFLDRGIIEINPVSDLKGPPPAASRERVLTAAEIKAFWNATDAIDWPFGPIYKLFLLTGQRSRSQVAPMTWAEIDFKRAVWTIPAQRVKNTRKTRAPKAHEVDLSPQALEILAKLPCERRGLVFTTTGNTPVSGFSKVKARIDKLMKSELCPEGTPDEAGVVFSSWRNHDLRRTMSTLMGEELEIDSGVIERAINHISGEQAGIKGVYQRQQYRQKRKAAMLAWGAWVSRLVSGAEIHANVVNLAEHR